jgi:mannose-6-phosphate isomerase-like protein (cupin superfamily)
MNRCLQIMKGLSKDTSLYADLIRTDKRRIRISVELEDTHETATLLLGDKIEVVDGSVNPDGKLSMTGQILNDIAEGRADAFALAGRGGSDEVRSIEFEIYSKERGEEVWETIRALLTYFFTPGKIKIKRLNLELAGEAHGAHPIPLVYWEELRYSWYFVKNGEVLNKEREKAPYPQMFIIIEGKGKAIIGNEEFELKPKTAVYVPRNSVHQIIAKEDVELIWLGWQTPR